jgi:hypothetical protein
LPLVASVARSRPGEHAGAAGFCLPGASRNRLSSSTIGAIFRTNSTLVQRHTRSENRLSIMATFSSTGCNRRRWGRSGGLLRVGPTRSGSVPNTLASFLRREGHSFAANVTRMGMIILTATPGEEWVRLGKRRPCPRAGYYCRCRLQRAFGHRQRMPGWAAIRIDHPDRQAARRWQLSKA